MQSRSQVYLSFLATFGHTTARMTFFLPSFDSAHCPVTLVAVPVVRALLYCPGACQGIVRHGVSTKVQFIGHNRSLSTAEYLPVIQPVF